MSKITPCLWFNGNAEEAVNFYVSVIPDSRIVHMQRNVIEGPSGKPGSILLIEFVIGDQAFSALNGGMHFDYTHAVSFYIDCADQAEIDRLWRDLGAGGEEVACGWLKDRYGVSWQIVPGELKTMLADPDTAKAARMMDAMMQMVKLDLAALRKAFDGA